MRISKVIAATIAIYATGVFTGALVTRQLTKPSAPEARFGPPMGRWGSPSTFSSRNEREPSDYYISSFLRRMSKVDLNDDQEKTIRTILEASHARMKELRKDFSDPLKDEFEKVKVEIEAVLTPDQVERFRESFKRRRGEGGRRRGDGGRHRSRDREGGEEARPERPNQP